MSGASVVRGLVGAGGILGGAYGAWLLLRTGLANVLDAAVWLVAGVIVHDALLAPLTVVVTAVALRVVPAALRAHLAAAGVVIATTTVVAIPVLGRPGAEADNPSLLPRDYVVGWLVLLGLVLVVTLGTVVLDRVRTRRHGND